MAEPAFAPHSSGLLVPAAVARTREVWTRDEWKAVDRAAKFLNGHQIATAMRCLKPDCPAPSLDAAHRPGGQLVIRCGCTDRIFTR